MAGPPPYLESQESCQCLSKSRRKYERAPPPTRPALPSPKLLNFSLFGNSNFWSSSHNLGGLEKGHEATGNPHQEPASAADPGGTRGHWCAGPRRNAQGCTAAATGTGTGARGWRGRAEAARPAPPAPHTRPLAPVPKGPRENSTWAQACEPESYCAATPTNLFSALIFSGAG